MPRGDNARTLRNWAVLGEPVLISTNGGFNLYMGNNPWNRWGGYMWPAPPSSWPPRKTSTS